MNLQDTKIKFKGKLHQAVELVYVGGLQMLSFENQKEGFLIIVSGINKNQVYLDGGNFKYVGQGQIIHL